MSKVSVFITIDTEHSIGGAFKDPNLKPVGNDRRIFGIFRNKAYGIPLIMDIADQYGIRLTFFVEILNKYYFGEEESREVCQYILDRGHNVQLHLHPNFLNFTQSNPADRKFQDQMFSYSLEQQAAFIAEGKAALERYGVPSPTAFRAGNFGADMYTLKALQQNGFLIDSSYNRSMLGQGCKLTTLDLADAAFVENVWEFPVTNFLEQTLGGKLRFRPLDINGVSFTQMQKVIEQAPDHGPQNITILLHSFSFINPLDVQYREIQPRTVIIKRFEKICCYLAKSTNNFRVMTFGDMTSALLSEMNGKVKHHIPQLSVFSSLRRNIEQVWDMLPRKRIVIHS